MNKVINFIIIFVILLMLGLQNAYAQCAMCKTTIENNVSSGDVAFASKLNIGIMYLLFAPYILVAVIGYLWYRNSKANAKKIKISSYRRR
ncbi:MAG: hypothetical protein M3512_05310 [Bacteroidota bacterium]|nr:hypothetical protein [Bacteroidota bacterium]